MYENALRLNCACVRTVLVSELCLCQNSVCVRNCLHAMSGCRALNGLACRPGFCAGLVRLGGGRARFRHACRDMFCRRCLPAERFVGVFCRCEACLSAAACIVNVVAGSVTVCGSVE